MTEGSPRDRELRRYETILDSLDDAVYAVRPDGTIAYVNDRYAEMKGVSREALLGTDIYDWVTEETAEKATQVRNEMAAGDATSAWSSTSSSRQTGSDSQRRCASTG